MCRERGPSEILSTCDWPHLLIWGSVKVAWELVICTASSFLSSNCISLSKHPKIFYEHHCWLHLGCVVVHESCARMRWTYDSWDTLIVDCSVSELPWDIKLHNENLILHSVHLVRCFDENRFQQKTLSKDCGESWKDSDNWSYYAASLSAIDPQVPGTAKIKS